ncbi:uncharacterized protein PG998_001836 [Apiospora kogelbergensis]|uniref:uncharacterized protein n=1 Tax=Apiospora kogelbergensis TaxID=1337665 RepID=UPI003130A636
MDDATTIASDLLQKLGHLEQKVQDHRQEMATQFQRYSRSLLETATDHVSVQVEHAIRDSLHRYPAISPALDQANPIKNNTTCRSHPHDTKSTATADRSKRNKGSPPPILPHTSGTPAVEDSPRSPHAREREFHGLFTPSYLTLLGADNTNSRDTLSPPTSPPALPPGPQTQETASATPLPAKSEQDSLSSLAAVTDSRPTPARRPTQDTISSNTSDDSSVRNRRSALRRSSSSSTSKTQSPRRVRFEVEGGEVLPTMSPPTSPRFAEHLPSPLGNSEYGDEGHTSGTIAEEDEDSVGLLGSSPPSLPKKVSSTDRLKALARTSNEDTSQWAVVGDSQDADDDDDLLVMGGLKPRLGKSQYKTTASMGGGGHAGQPRISQPPKLGDEGDDAQETGVEQVEDVDDEDGDLLTMPALSSFKGRKKFSPIEPSPLSEAAPNTPNPVVTLKEPAASEPLALHHNNSDSQAEEEDMFDWDSDETEPTSKTKRNGDAKEPKKYLEEEDEEVIDQGETPAEESQNERSPTTLFSTSPAVPIQKPSSIPMQASTPPRTSAASIGSFRGRPFSMSSVKEGEAIRRASELGNMQSFVGSVDGRSGLDESSSYRPIRGQYSGTPKSFSERLMMEDLIEAHEGSADAKSGRPN